ncbi:MAG: hypothetical protein WAU91_09910, partial [Desulfatitalea sp.]
QVVLSFGLPFAVIPLIQFSRRSDLMKELVNRRTTTALACLVAGLIVIGTYGKSGAAAFWTQSIGAKVLAQTLRPLLLVQV